MINSEQLRNLSSIEVGSLDAASLTELDSVSVNKRLAKEARILEFIREIRNPYCFVVGGSVVKTTFSEGGGSLRDLLVNYANM